MPLNHPSTVAAPGQSTARTFFEYVCPILLTAHRERARAWMGRCAFDLEGAGGGRWTIDLGAFTVEPRIAAADLKVEMSAHDFAAMMQDAGAPETLLRSGAMRYEGDPALFRQLALLTDLEAAGMRGPHQVSTTPLTRTEKERAR